MADDAIRPRCAASTCPAGWTMLRRAATLADVGNAAVLGASDLARSVTATQLNITCGAMVD